MNYAALSNDVGVSASTSSSFLKGIESFRATSSDCLEEAIVLYNGDQTFTIHGACIFNPLASGESPYCPHR